jgi:hypothetical protein
LSKTPYWTTKKFKKLQDVWNKRLEQDGFRDAEKNSRGVERNLIAHSNPFRHSTSDEVEVKQEYFERMSHKAYNALSKANPLDRLTMTRYVEGTMIKDIVKELRARGMYKPRQTVSKIIKKYEKLWKIKLIIK